MKENKQEEFLRVVMGSDMEFYEQFLKDLSEEELKNFLDANPDFLKD